MAPSFSCSEDSGLGWVTATLALGTSCCLPQEQLPMVKPRHVGPKVSWEGSKNPAGAEVAASILREGSVLLPAAGGRWVPDAELLLGLLPAATGGPVVSG